MTTVSFDEENHHDELEKNDAGKMDNLSTSIGTNDTNITQDTIVMDNDNNDDDKDDGDDEFSENEAIADTTCQDDDADDNDKDKVVEKEAGLHWMKSMSKISIVLVVVGILSVITLGGIFVAMKLSPGDSASVPSSTPPLHEEDEAEEQMGYSSDEDEQQDHDNHGPIVESGPINQPSWMPTTKPSFVIASNNTTEDTSTTKTTSFPSASPTTITKTQPTTFVTTPTVSVSENATSSVPTSFVSSSAPTMTTTSPTNIPSTTPTTRTNDTNAPSAILSNSPTVKATNSPTQNPTSSPTEDPFTLVTLPNPTDFFLQSNTEIVSDETFYHLHSDLYLTQHNDGSLVLYKGDGNGLDGDDTSSVAKRKATDILWSNGVSLAIGSYWTRLQGDGNLVTMAGSPQNPGRAIWASGSVRGEGSYKLVPNDDSTGIELQSSVGANAPAFWSSQEGVIRSGSTFCVVADVPYNDGEANELPSRMERMPGDCAFAIHLGDIKAGGGGSPCVNSVYERTKQSLWKSPIPTFIVIGDNEWNDCPGGQRQQGLNLWKQHFTNFENYWNHAYLGQIHRDPNRQENFGFVYKSTLFIGLNIVGGEVINGGEWGTRLSQNVNWIRDMMRTHVLRNQSAKGVVIFGHAEPRGEHNNFFLPLEAFIRDELKNEIPILYLHGDGHRWKVVHPFYGQTSFLGVMVEGRRTTVKVNADPVNFGGNNVRQAYTFETIRW
mmetsp:Transcript_16373/g.23097  ORF Transcript_16373/g.23097 Transcript_16373/m.23097 type:complete len:719 (-) Transcript_16373:92-2248(-)